MGISIANQLAKFRTQRRRGLRQMFFYLARGQGDPATVNSFPDIRDYHGTSPGANSPNEFAAKDELTDDQARLFIICALLNVPYNTSWAQTQTDAGTALAALSP